MPATSLLGSTGSGASGCWREKARSRWVSAAARFAPFDGLVYQAQCTRITDVHAASEHVQ